MFRLISAYQDKIVKQNYGYWRDYLIRNFGGVSFKNFVNFVIERKKKKCKKLNICYLDRHWRPFISQCGYCTFKYKAIAKLETFNEDRKFIGKLAGVDLASIRLPFTETHLSRGGTSKDRSRKYFSELKLKTVKKLYKIYQVDFEMFGYSPLSYYDYAGQ